MTGKTYKTRKSPMNKTMKMNHGQYECCDAHLLVFIFGSNPCLKN